jgi:hypothetical protein
MANYTDELSPLSFVVLARAEVDPLFTYFWHNRDVENDYSERSWRRLSGLRSCAENG